MAAPVKASTGHWAPLVSGVEAAPAWALLERLERFLRRHSSPLPGLARGSAGAALFLHALARARGEPRDADVARELERAVEATLARPSLAFLDGLTGVGWAIAHVYGRRPPRPLGDLLRALDVQVLRAVRLPPEALHYDLGQGLAGLALYGVERGGATGLAILAQAVEALERRLSWRGRSAFIRTEPRFLSPPLAQRAPDGLVDLGVAHGLAGPLVVGALALRHGVASAVAERLVGGLGAFLSAQLRRWPVARGGLPPFTGGGPSVPGRLAWCYGSLGVAGAVLHASRLLGASRLEGNATAVLLGLGAPNQPLKTPTTLWLCHGMAGALHVLVRAANGAGRRTAPRLREQAQSWLERLLARAGDPPTPAARRVWVDWPLAGGPTPEEQPTGLLEGAAGLGLSLLGAVSPLPPRWDRLLLLSSAPG